MASYTFTRTRCDMFACTRTQACPGGRTYPHLARRAPLLHLRQRQVVVLPERLEDRGPIGSRRRSGRHKAGVRNGELNQTRLAGPVPRELLVRRSRHRFGGGIAALGVSIRNHWQSASANLSGPGLSISQCISPSAGPLAHREEQGTFNPKVPGSRPGRPTKNPSADRPWNHWDRSALLVTRNALASSFLPVTRHSCSPSVGRAWANRDGPRNRQRGVGMSSQFGPTVRI